MKASIFSSVESSRDPDGSLKGLDIGVLVVGVVTIGGGRAPLA
jgi:hypothetical protein